MKKIVVIGANHAGTAAINTILDTYTDCEVTAFDANSNISFLGCGMALWIGDQIQGSDGLFYSSKQAMLDKGANVYMEAPVQKVDYENKKVYAETKDGEKIVANYDRLILATGSLPIQPKIPGMELDNVQFVKLFQNAQDVIDKLEAQKEIQKVTVVGAGYIGVELAEAFSRKGKKVTLIDAANTCLSGYYDPDFTKIMDQNLKDNGITVAYQEMVTALEGDTKVKTVITNTGSYATDMVVFAIGFTPNTALGKEHVKVFKNGAYVVNRKQETSQKDVYAIGDCATVYNNAIQDIDYIALATNAVRSGIIAAHNACGTALESVGVQGSNGIRIWDVNMFSTGLTLQKAKAYGYDAIATDFEDFQKPAFIEHDNEKVKIKIVYDKQSRRILGAQMASKYDISMGIHMFSLAVQEGVTIDTLKLFDVFFLPHFNQPYNYITMAAITAK